MQPDSQNITLGQKLYNAKTNIEIGHFEDAERILKEILESDPNHLESSAILLDLKLNHIRSKGIETVTYQNVDTIESIVSLDEFKKLLELVRNNDTSNKYADSKAKGIKLLDEWEKAIIEKKRLHDLEIDQFFKKQAVAEEREKKLVQMRADLIKNANEFIMKKGAGSNLYFERLEKLLVRFGSSLKSSTTPDIKVNGLRAAVKMYRYAPGEILDIGEDYVHIADGTKLSGIRFTCNNRLGYEEKTRLLKELVNESNTVFNKMMGR